MGAFVSIKGGKIWLRPLCDFTTALLRLTLRIAREQNPTVGNQAPNWPGIDKIHLLHYAAENEERHIQNDTHVLIFVSPPIKSSRNSTLQLLVLLTADPRVFMGRFFWMQQRSS